MKKLKTRVLSFVLAITLAVGLVPMTAVAVKAETVTDISNAAGLAAIAKSGGAYRLTEDITLDNWTPIYPSGDFTLDGNGHTITLSGTKMFESLPKGAVVKNLILKGSVSETKNINTGVITGDCKGTIRNCMSSATVDFKGTSPYIYVGGLAGKATGTISNCLVTGKVTAGATPFYGAVTSIALFESCTIKNCIAVGTDRIASEEGWDGAEVVNGTDCTLIANAADFKPDSYVDTLNASLQEGDLSWSVKDGVLAPRASSQEKPDPDAEEADLNALNAAILAAEKVDASKVYTADSWSAFTKALDEAKKMQSADEKKQSKVVSVTENLKNAQTDLVEKKLEAVDLSDKEVISIKTADDLEDLRPGKYYRLDADITIGDWWFGTYNTMNAVLDGNGHTITLKGAALWKNIGPNGVIQNVGILGSATGTNDMGAIAGNCEGLIINCWSRAEINSAGQNNNRKNTGGFVANLLSGGAVINSYVAGTVSAKGTAGNGVTGAIAATSEANTKIGNCYWLTTANANGCGTPKGTVSECSAKVREDFYSEEFLGLLNQKKGSNGKTWTINEDGWAHLGEAGNFVPPQPAELCYTAYEGYGSGETLFSETNGLILSLDEVLPDEGATVNYYVGKFTYPGYNGEIEWQPQYVGSGQGKHNVFLSENGELQVLGAGSLDVVAYDKNTWKKLAAFTITVSDIQAEKLRLVPSGKYVKETKNGAYEVEGSGIVTLNTEVFVDGKWKGAPSSLFEYELSGKVFTTGGNTFYATEPGVVQAKVTGLGKTAQLDITSTYVATTSIKPAANGTYVVHDRNANSGELGDFLDLTLGSQAGTVIVEPENASYRDSWKMSSSDTDVAEYVQAFLLAVLPKKAGTTTLTATSLDPNLSEPVTGSSEISIKYFNPLTKVSMEQETITVDENKNLVLPLTFTGSEGKEGYHVTEPGMVWTFEGTGEVSITRSPLGEIVGGSGSKEYCVATTEYKLTGEKAGTVTVTGTPVDTTGGAKPIVFQVEVKAGEQEAAADIDKIVSDGMKDASAVIANAYKEGNYQYGDEWVVFLLARENKLTAAQAQAYLNSIEKTYTNPKSSALKPTTLARVILTVSALGKDASNLKGINLVQLLCNRKMIGEGSNEAAWSLIALDSRGYEIPNDAKWNRDSIIDAVLTFQNKNGGFGLNSNESADADLTAMCIQGLAPYYGTNEKVKTAVDSALAYLKKQMDRNCDLGTSEGTAQTIIALTALKIDPLDETSGFAKSKARNLLTALEAYRVDGSGFKHMLNDAKVNNMSAIQAMQALVAYDRYRSGKPALYDLKDAEKTPDYNGEITVPSAPGTSEDLDAGKVPGKDNGNIGNSPNTPDNSNTPNAATADKTQIKNTVKTGDVAYVWFFCMLMITAGGVAAGTVVYRRKMR